MKSVSDNKDTDEKPDVVDETEKTEKVDETENDAADGAGTTAATEIETSAAAVAEPADTVTTDGSAARRWRRPVLIGVVVAAFVAVAGTAGYLGWQLNQERQIEQAGEQARQAATDYAQVLTSIDSDKVDENFDAVLDGATGGFKDMYSQSSAELRQLLIDNKATARGVVQESAVQSASKDEVVVLLFVDQSITNTNVPDPRLDRSRIKMTMQYVDGRWRASKVELP